MQVLLSGIINRTPALSKWPGQASIIMVEEVIDDWDLAKVRAGHWLDHGMSKVYLHLANGDLWYMTRAGRRWIQMSNHMRVKRQTDFPVRVRRAIEAEKLRRS